MRNQGGEAKTSSPFLVSGGVIVADQPNPASNRASSPSAHASACPLHVFDLHGDTIDALGMADCEPYATHFAELLEQGIDPSGTLEHNGGHLALDRMGTDRGFAWCQCFAIWIPDMYHRHGAHDFYCKARDWFFDQVRRFSDRVTLLRDARDIDGVLASGKTAAFLTVENASVLNHSVRAIDELAADGVKMITLTWNDRNPIGSGSLTDEGLTTFGREAIRGLEDARIVVDVSHLNDAGFADFVDIARRPFAASHSNARAVCDVPRNLTDDQFRAIRDAGGVVGLNYCRGFLTTRNVAETGADVTFDEVAAHIEHFLDLGGEDVIALGSDYDGSDVPAWLDGCEKVGGFYELVQARFGEWIARKMFFENARDFFVRNETA